MPETLSGIPAATLLAALPDTVVVADARGVITYVNPAVSTLLGHAPADLLGLPLTAIMPVRFRAAHPSHLARFLSTGEGQLVGATTQLPALHASGHEVSIDVTLGVVEPGPGVGSGGSAIVGVLRDASTTILLERQLQVSRYLAATLRVTAALTEAHDADVAFQSLLPTLCTELDWDAATLWRPESHGRLVHVGTWTADDPDAPAPQVATHRHAFDRGEGLPGLVWQRREPLVIEDLWTDHRFLRQDAARADALRTAVAFPVLQGDTVLGVVELFAREQRTVPIDLLDVLGHAGRQVGQFLGRLRAESEVRDLAETLQRSLLPSHLPTIPGAGLAARYRSGGDSTLVGGDTYDVMPLPDGRWMVLIADVCGTGAEAAALTALTRHTARAAASSGCPGDVLAAVNEALLRELEGEPLRFVTACCLVLDPGRRARIAAAGHPLPLLSTGRSVTAVGSRGRPLGVEQDARFDEVCVDLPPGSALVLYTDGATEARDDTGAQIGEEGLARIVGSVPPSDPERIVEAVQRGVDSQLRSSRHQADDLAVLALTFPA